MSTRNRLKAILSLVLALIATATSGCDSRVESVPTYGKVDYLLVYHPDEAPIIVEALGMAKQYLERMNVGAVKLLPLSQTSWSQLSLNASKGVIVFSGEWFAKHSLLAKAKRDGLSGDAFAIAGQLRGALPIYEIWGTGRRSRLYSIFHLIHLFGVRYFHPEEEVVPTTASLPALPFEALEVPIYKYRGFNLHTTHPVELLDDFDSTEPVAQRRATNFMWWMLKNKQNYCGIGGSNPEIIRLKREGGCLKTTGLNLTNIQQGGHPLLTPTDPLEVNLDKIEAQLLRAFADPNNLPETFGVAATDTEVFNSDATKQQILEWFTFATSWVHEHYPQVYLLNNVHITKEELIPELGVDVNMVHTLLPPYVGLKIHTVMFYGLTGPAPAYGHTTFEDRFALFKSELAKGRRMWYYPESAWWLTFDNTIPLFLPLYTKMRWEDMKLLEPMIPQGIDGHELFSTGHEWGYWMIDYCVIRMSWAHKISWEQCTSEITDTMGAAGADVQKVIVEMGDYQKATLIERDLMRWVVGEDELAELGANTDKAAHRIRIPFTLLNSWDLATVQTFRGKDLADMLEMEQTYKGYLERLTPLAATVAPGGKHIYDEVVDGTEINHLRAKQIRLIYEALLDAREALLTGKIDLLNGARERLAQAKAVTTSATTVVRRREKQYRYPLLLSTEGSRDNPVPNRTSYPFRVHSDTHTLFFWHRRDTQAAQALALMESQLVSIDDRVSAQTRPVTVTVSPLIGGDSLVDFGDGTTLTSDKLVPHQYSQQGIFTLALTDGGKTLFSEPVAVVEKRLYFKMDTLKVTQPKEAASTIFLIRGLLPHIILGTGAVHVFAHDANRDGRSDSLSLRQLTQNGAGYQAFDWAFEITGSPVTFFDTALSLEERDGKPLLMISAKLDKAQLSNFIVKLGGHIDEASLNAILSSIFPNPVIVGDRTLYPIEGELTE